MLSVELHQEQVNKTVPDCQPRAPSLHPTCEELCPTFLHCPARADCPRYGECKPYVHVRKLARLIVYAKQQFAKSEPIAANNIYYSLYTGPADFPENDPNFILGWLASLLLPRSAENNKLVYAEVARIFPDSVKYPDLLSKFQRLEE